MAHLDGAGLAAPQIGVHLRVVIFGVENNPRYPNAEAVPETILINPHLTPLADDEEEGWGRLPFSTRTAWSGTSLPASAIRGA